MQTLQYEKSHGHPDFALSAMQSAQKLWSHSSQCPDGSFALHRLHRHFSDMMRSDQLAQSAHTKAPHEHAVDP